MSLSPNVNFRASFYPIEEPTSKECVREESGRRRWLDNIKDFCERLKKLEEEN